jgi:patatin-like phospholipase/acyl hydrolase
MKKIFLYLSLTLISTTPSFSQEVVTVLSIDGGGIRGIIPAVVLEHLEFRLNKPISECFDVMVGTSTGGIIILCLSAPDENNKPRYSAKQLVQLYKNFGETIFNQSLWQRIKTFNGWIGPKYSEENLEKLLKTYLGKITLKEALTEVVIPTFDIEEGNTEFFTTNQARTKEGRNFYMRDLARATAAAPSYFSPYKIQENSQGQKKEKTFVDGGLTVNNPIIASYIYATNLYNQRNTEFFFVSIGTGDPRSSGEHKVVSYEEVKNSGKIGWANHILNLVMDGVKNLSDGQMQFMFPYHGNSVCGLDTHYVRLQISLNPEHAEMDNASPENIAKLEEYAHQLIENSKDKIDTIIRVLNMQASRKIKK